MLYLIPSPIGNLGDMTYRAVTVLQQADGILCEDTRTSAVLLRHYNIQQPLTPYHQHNEHKIWPHLTAQMLSGKTYALLTDAGTPGISDPGFLLVRECIRAGIPVNCLPGATAFIPALIQSGIPGNRFVFEGFLPLKKGRKTLLARLEAEERTIILYESPYRLVKTLNELQGHFGETRLAAVCRELTKMFEETRRGTLAELAEYYTTHPPKGEIVLIIAGNDMQPASGKTDGEKSTKRGNR